MEEKGWIKLHRRLLNNDIFHDENALKVFLWLLLKVDRVTGEKKIARTWAIQELCMKPTTYYDALQRVVKRYKMATAKPTANYTIIKLINWHKYQEPDRLPDQSPTAARQQPDTLQEVRSKNREDTHMSAEKKKNAPSKRKTPEHKKRTWLVNIPLEELVKFEKKYKASRDQVKDKGEGLYNWAMEKNVKGRDWRYSLHNAMKRDYGKRGKTQFEGAISPDDPRVW